MAGETILIVEDDGILALHLQDMLAGLGYRVAGPVATGEAALASVAAQCPDLILMDIELAGMMNGIATAEQIKSAADIPVVFLTGYSQDPLFQEAKLIAPYGYLIKPVPERELAVTLELALYRYNINKKLSERELALRKSEERFWHLFESSVAGVALHEIICDEAGVPCDYRFLQVNPAFERATGLKTRDIVGHTVREILPHTEPHWIERYGRVALTGEPIQFEEYSADLGKYFEVTAYAPMPGHFAVSFLDVTVRKLAEKVLRETVAELTLIQDSVPVAMLLLDRDRRVCKANAAAAGFAYRTAEEMIGLHGGEALRCLRSLDDPAGCGFGPGCAVCPVRNTVLDTFANGKNHKHVEACLPFPRADAVEERCLLISTSYLQMDGLERVLLCAEDITETKRAVRQIKNQMEFVTTLLDTIPSPVFYKDSAGRYLGCNRATEDIWATTKESIVGKTVYDIHPKEIADQYAAMDEELLRRRGTQTYEWRARRADGTIRDVVFSKAVFKDANDQVAGLVGVMLDITDRKRAEEALRDAEVRYRLLFEQSPDGIVILDPQTMRFLEFNERAHRQLGYSRAEFASLRISDIHAVETAGEIESRIARVLREGRVDFETRLRTREGEIRDIHMTAQVVTISDHPVHYCVWRDITDRKSAEKELRESDERLRMTAEAGNVGLWDWDLRSNRVRYSTVWKRQIGFEDHEISDHFDEWRSRVHPDDIDRVLTRIQESVSASCLRFENEFRLRHKDGSYRTIVAQASAHYDESGKPNHILGSHFDITERKQAEEKRQKLEEQLRQAQKMEAVGQLAGGVAHDFNNLLQVITGYSQLLAADLTPGTREHQEVKDILKAGERAGTLVRQLLAFSRRETLQITTLDMNRLIPDLSKMLRRLIGEHIDLALELGAGELTICADPGQIEQVLMNLCINARDAMPDGGKLTLETSPVELTEDLTKAYPETRPGSYVLLRVSDTGHGMAAEVLERVFEPFFTTKGVGKGTGLGLATVYGIVKQHGGLVTCSSEPGKGASFFVYLPRTIETLGAFGVQDDALEIPGGTETLLLAEDESLVRNLSRQILSSGGYRVLSAKDGHEAKELYEAHAGEIALAILDVVMPGLNGKAVADHIRALNPEVPILFASGYDFAMLEGSLSAGEIANVIRKPYKREEFMRRVRQLLDESKGQELGE